MEILTALTAIIAIAWRSGASLLYATLGEILGERAGVLNLGVEGMLLISAMLAFATAYHTESTLLGVLAGALAGAVLALLFALLTILLQADQVVSGLALFILGSGLASFLGRRLGPDGTSLVGLTGPSLERISIPLLSEIPLLGSVLFDQDLLIYVLYLLVPALAYFLYKTRLGLHLRAVGENPATADALGIPVLSTRFITVVVGGVLVGLGGAHLSLAYSPGWTEGMTGGRGWIAIAMVIFALWDPLRAAAGSVLFGGISALQFRLQAAGSEVPSAFLRMLPYFFTLVVLVVASHPHLLRRRFGAPRALGKNYLPEISD